jgi:hypothetical protein
MKEGAQVRRDRAHAARYERHDLQFAARDVLDKALGDPGRSDQVGLEDAPPSSRRASSPIAV